MRTGVPEPRSVLPPGIAAQPVLEPPRTGLLGGAETMRRCHQTRGGPHWLWACEREASMAAAGITKGMKILAETLLAVDEEREKQLHFSS